MLGIARWAAIVWCSLAQIIAVSFVCPNTQCPKQPLCTCQCEAGRHSEAGYGVGIWHFFQKFALKFPACWQIIPVKYPKISPPRATHLTVVKYPKARPKKSATKISQNVTLQSLFANVAESPKTHFPVKSCCSSNNYY